MTEMTKTERKLCTVGRSMPSRCPYPATESLPDLLPGDGPHVCAYHAATEPLSRESDELAISLDLLRAYLKGAHRHPGAEPLVTVLERVEEDFGERLEILNKVLEDLKSAEYKLMRG